MFTKIAILTSRSSSIRLSAVRWHWQAYLTYRFDKETNTVKYDDWEKIMLGAQEPMKGNISLVQREERTPRYIKPTERRKRAAERVVYERSIQRVDDLAKYIKFHQAHKEDFKDDP
jgi:hypothetical protein